MQNCVRHVSGSKNCGNSCLSIYRRKILTGIGICIPMEKLKMHTLDLTAEKVRQMAELLPNCVTEAQDAHGTVHQTIDFDRLRQELSDHIVEGPRGTVPAGLARQAGGNPRCQCTHR